MNDLGLFDNDIYDLLLLLVERNKLAKARSSARGKLGRLKKARSKLVRHNMNVDEVNKAIALANQEYLKTCKNLAAFTKSNESFRREMSKKYATRQRNNASNEVESIKLRPIGWSEDVFFFKKDFERIVLENELNDILLGLPQI